VAATDRLTNGLSAVYTFFEPDSRIKGLGTYAVLWQIERAKQLGLTRLYLGYWIGACRKMSYKDNFRPLEAWNGRDWIPYPKGTAIVEALG